MSHEDDVPNGTGSEPHGTTTHAEWGAGEPRLFITGGDERAVFPITADEVRIGSSADNELTLAGAEPVHAVIVHDERDEYVLTLHGPGEMNARSEGTENRTEVLRTGARFTIADWTLVFSRAEFADHGRPYGGREGGEFSDEPAQPSRPDYLAPGDGDEPGPGYEVKQA